MSPAWTPPACCADSSWSLSCCTSFCRLCTRLALSTSAAGFASTLMFLTDEANCRVLRLSSKLRTAGLRVPIMAVLELPLSAFASNIVSLELRKTLMLMPWLFLAPPLGRFWMHVARNMRLMLMKVSSTMRSPVTFVVFSFSRPARSTKKASEVMWVFSLPPCFSRINLKMVCPRELCLFMAVAATVFMVLPYSMSLTTVSKESTASSLAPLT
mmetsp:Transcript_91669/g.278446  ORF Transcript_91669/g.278446 Transcript_91669/m.278446 type:complete len:213 (-) Transcript_91669:184-822(-)